MVLYDSLPAAVAAETDDFTTLPIARFPEWLNAVALPAGWSAVDAGESVWAPVRGPRRDGGFDASAALEVYGFTDLPTYDAVRFHADRALRVAQAQQITSRVLTTSARPGVVAVRTTGVVTTDGTPVWAQHSFYLAAADEPHAGRLIVQGLFAATDRRELYVGELTALADDLQAGFVAALGQD